MSVTAFILDPGPRPANLWVGLIALAFGVLVFWNGIQTWRGIETRRHDEWLRTKGSVPNVAGSRRMYQSPLGSSYFGLVFGPACVLYGAVELITLAAGENYLWPPWQVATTIAVIAGTLAGLFVTAYFWTGVPDVLRPPAQRGWKWVDGALTLVRPGETEEERRQRAPITPPANRRANQF